MAEGTLPLRTPQLNRDTISDDALRERLLNRSISNLRDLQFTYGVLSTLGLMGTQPGSEYLTPDAAAELLGGSDARGIAPETLIEVRLTYDPTDDPEFALSLDSIAARVLDVPTLCRAGYSRDQARRGVDNSLTRVPTTQPKPMDYWANEETTYGKWYGKVVQTLKWATEQPVQTVADGHPDGHLIQALAYRYRDEMWCRDVLMPKVASTLPIVTEAEAHAADTDLPTEMRAMITFAFNHLQPDKDSSRDGTVADDERFELTEKADGHEAAGKEWYLPGEISVLLAALKARRTHKLATRNDADARGHGVCFVTGEETDVVGTIDDPTDWFQTKQRGYFPSFNRDLAWTAQPLSPRAAINIANAEGFIDACYDTVYQKRLYLLPYFAGEQTPLKARALYTLLRAIDIGDNTPIEDAYRVLTGSEDASVPVPDSVRAVIAEASNNAEPADMVGGNTPDVDARALLTDLRFYVLAGKATQAGFDCFYEVSSAAIHPVLDLADAHSAILLGPWYSDGGAQHNLPAAESSPHRGAIFPTSTPDSWPLLAPDMAAEVRRERILGGEYFTDSGVYLAFNEDGDEWAEGDPRLEAILGVLGRSHINVETLLDGFVAAHPVLVDWNDTRTLTYQVAGQFAQLQALAVAGRLGPSDHPLTIPPKYMTDPDTNTDDTSDNDSNGQEASVGTATNQDVERDTSSTSTDMTTTERRHARLEQFLTDHPGLTENDERQAAFLLGVLVARIARFQRYGPPQVSNTLIQRYRPDSITPSRLRSLITEVLDRVQTYSEVYNDGAQMYQELTSRLTDLIAGTDPRDWSLSRSDLKMHYALGIAYGRSDRDTSTATDEATEKNPKDDTNNEQTV